MINLFVYVAVSMAATSGFLGHTWVLLLKRYIDIEDQ